MSGRLSSAYWHARGEETRTLAEAMENQNNRLTMLEIANQYDKLAEFAEAQERRPAAPERANSNYN